MTTESYKLRYPGWTVYVDKDGFCVHCYEVQPGYRTRKVTWISQRSMLMRALDREDIHPRKTYFLDHGKIKQFRAEQNTHRRTQWRTRYARRNP